jgi:hypothetical protein
MVPFISFRWLGFALSWAVFVVSALTARAEVNAEEQEIFNLLKNDPGQGRPFVTLDPILCQVARARAADMGDRGYYDHTDPDGHGPNWWVYQAGYQLPANYDHSGDANNIESASVGRSSAGDTWDSWMGSPPHKAHLLAENSFYASQTSVGVGFVRRRGSDYTYYWVVLTAPPSGPQLTIKSPAGGTEVNEPTLTMNGTTSGDPGATLVQVRIENAVGNGAWTNASGAAWWTVTLSGLEPGANILRARSLDAGGALLKEAARNIRYVVLTPLSVQVSGQGSVTDGFSGTSMREVGVAYRVTALPDTGWIFAGWTGSMTGSTPTARFVMAEGMSLVANFVPNPFVEGAGRYTGLFSLNGKHGVARLRLTRNGAFTGRAKLGRASVVLSGRFSAAGDAQISATGSDGKNYTTTLHYDSASAHVSGSFAWPTGSVPIALDRLMFATNGASQYAGRYTVVLPSASDLPANVPQGDGIATLTIDSDGIVTGGGVLADGTPFGIHGSLTTGGELPIYAALYDGGGLLTGSLAFRSTETSDVVGTLDWSRPARAGAVLFASGFALSLPCVGSRYVQPGTGQPVVPVAPTSNNAKLVLGDGGIGAPVSQAATLNADNSVVISAPELDQLSLRVNAKSGRFAGQFVHPQTGASTPFRGVILQKQQAGFGFFAGASGGGYATFAPAGMVPRLAAP